MAGTRTAKARTSTAVSQVVNTATSTVALVSSPNPSAFGCGVTLTATVTAGATGSVAFHEGTTVLGTGTISSGVATLTISSLAGGTHSITAQYGGDSNYSGSVSTAVSQVVNTLSSTVALVSSPNPSAFGSGVTFTATLPTNATGTVTFLDGATSLGTGTISSGVATLTISSLAGGTHSITAQYGGDSNYSGSVSTPVSQVVNRLSSTVALTSSPNPSAFGSGVTLTATVTAGATGTVTFHDGATSLGTGIISSGIATLTISSLAGGTHSITAQYGGDSNYSGSVSTPVSQVVNTLSSTVALTSSPNPSAFGSGVTLTATVTAGATGTVTFHEGATVLGTGAISSGVATLTISSLTGGTHSITAQYGGDTNYSGSVSTPVSQVVTMVSSTVALASSPNPSSFGAGVTLTATATAGATGTVTFHEGTTVLGTGTISSGAATLTISSLAGGTHSITAQYGGDANYSGSVSTPVSQVVNPVTTAVALASSLNPSNLGASVTFTATLPVDATGAVTYYDGSTALGTGSLSSGIATLTTALLTPGTHSITAQYGGDFNHTAAVSTPVSQIVNSAPAVTLTSSPNPSTFGASVTFTATFPLAATGTVTFYDGTTVLGTVSLSGGVASLTISSLAAGAHSIRVLYGGNARVAPVVSDPLSHVVDPLSSTVALNISPNPATQGRPVTLTVTVPASATGTVTFNDGTTVIGTGAVANGAATLTVTNLATGSHSITAVYGGDANHTAATSPAVSLTINSAVTADFNVTNQTPAQLIPPGASASYQIAITSVNLPFTNAVTLGATNLPQGATFTFAPSTITPGNAGATSTFTVSVPKQIAALHRSPRVPLILAVVLLPFAALKRARVKPHRLLIWLVVSLGFIGSAIGCGSGGYFNQPQQTYVITVTGTSGNLVHSTTATLTVQ